MLLEARVTALSCQWLMGTCSVNSVDLPNGSTWSSGVMFPVYNVLTYTERVTILVGVGIC